MAPSRAGTKTASEVQWIPYFVSCRQGAEEAARELGVKLLWDGPTETDAAKQNEVVEAWITRRVNVIAAASWAARASSRSSRRP